MKKLMGMNKISLGMLAAGFMVGQPANVNALINAELWGTAPPSLTLGGYHLQAFPTDSRGLGASVTTFAPPSDAPVLGDVVSNIPLEHSSVGSGWGSWGHSYDGDVYWLDEETYGTFDPGTQQYASSLTLTLPADTKAFALYLEPNFLGTFDFLVTAGGTSHALQIDGNGGAQGIGFYTDDPNASLVSLQIGREGDFSDGYAIGEFSINTLATNGVPEGGIPSAVLAGVIGGLFIIHQSARGNTRQPNP